MAEDDNNSPRDGSDSKDRLPDTESRGERGSGQGPPDDYGPLPFGPNWEFWSERNSTEDDREKYLTRVNRAYHLLVDEFYDSANQSVKPYKRHSRSHLLWRWGVIIGAGAVAIVNLTAAFITGGDVNTLIWFKVKDLDQWVSIGAAVLAALLVTATNLENFTNASEKAQGYRESRDLFLDAARHYERLWRTHV